jgi:hypothetical protein
MRKARSTMQQHQPREAKGSVALTWRGGSGTQQYDELGWLLARLVKN